MRGTLYRVVLAIVLTLFPYVVMAQTAGSIAGEVKDTSGAVMPGVTVEVASPALIEKVRTAVTDSSGQYKIIDLRPGTYTVTFTLTGFSTVKREGIEVTSGFTAQINGELRVGSLQETVVVTGESPVVDVQNVRQQRVLTREVLDAIPTAKSLANLAALVPGVNVLQTSSGSGQDVGGTAGENFQGLTIHGGRRNDQQTLLDGMSVGFMAFFEGSITPTSLGDGTVEQTILEVSGHSAEVESGGIVANLVPKQGGNNFSGSFFANFASDATQANNYSDDLKRRGLAAPQPVKRISDVNPSFGGPIKRDRLWFFVAYRDKRSIIYTDANAKGFNLNPSGWTFVPDLDRRPVQDQITRDSANRLTWQVSAKHRLALMYNFNDKLENNAGGGPLGTYQATYVQVWQPKILQVTWSAPVTSRLLFDAGMSLTDILHTMTQHPEAVGPTALESTTGLRFRAPSFGSGIAPQVDVDGTERNDVFRGAVSYVTGAHAFKVGFMQQNGSVKKDIAAPADYEVTLFNGRPNFVTYLGTPYTFIDHMNKFALYGQDQWRLGNMTINAGLRFDWLRTHYPDYQIAATNLLPARTFASADVLNWKDVSPRLGWSYDVFGDGKTAIKVSASRYVLQEAMSLTRSIDPTTTSAGTLTRTWVDNGDFIPQGDPLNPAANGEIGPSPNNNFGKPVTTLRYDPAFQSGYGVRPYNWEITAGLQRELLPRVSANVAYFRRWFGNFTVVDNELVAGSDYDQFCITAPTDSRLPGGGGQQICGLRDLNPSRLGRLQNVGTSVESYGKQTERWQGVDLTVNARLAKLLLQGGMSTGKTIRDNCEIYAKVPEAGTSGVGGPLGGPYCRQEEPFLTQVKFLGSYTFPWSIQTSATFQSVPGAQRLATYLATNAQIAPSLGRNLSAGATARASVQLIAPGSVFGPRVNQVDARFSRTFNVRATRIKGMVDLYNLTNNNVDLLWNNNYGTDGASWLRPNQILGARMIKLGVQVDF